MCGIAGFCLADGERVNTRQLAGELLLGIEERGRHATGVAFYDSGRLFIQKAAMPASHFVPFLDMPTDAPTAILHTRWATQGDPADNANNHPIDCAGIVGVHNGCVSNDDALFARLPRGARTAAVDSEAIFATLNYGQEPPAQALTRVRGSAAVAWLDTAGDPRTLHIARLERSPLVVGVTPAGSHLFASTVTALRRAARNSGLTLDATVELPEGVYRRIHAGHTVAHATFPVNHRDLSTVPVVERTALGV